MNKIESILLNNLFNEEELKDIGSKIVDNKFKIHKRIHGIFENVHFDIKKE
jgi:DNA modification methylase